MNRSPSKGDTQYEDLPMNLDSSQEPTIEPPEEDVAREPGYWNIPRGLLWVTFFLLVLLLGVKYLDFQRFLKPGFEPPKLDEIVSVTASSPNDDYLSFSTFEVARKYWPRLLAALTPSRYDAQPEDHPVLCRMQVTDIDGRNFRLTVFYVEGDEQGAYSLFSPRYDREEFYRGGNTRQFLDALIAAGEGEVVEQMVEDEAK